MRGQMRARCIQLSSVFVFVYFNSLNSLSLAAILTSPNVVSNSEELDPIEESRPAGPLVLPKEL